MAWMSSDSKRRGDGRFIDEFDATIDLSPADSQAGKIVKETVKLVATLGAPAVGPLAPALVELVKSVASVLGFHFQRRKAERARDLILALYERLQNALPEYVTREEFLDLFEDTLRRTAEQPDKQRREAMRRVFFKIIDEPREHVENRLLVRLADELPLDALKALPALNTRLTKTDRGEDNGRSFLAARTEMPPVALWKVLGYLANENLLDEDNVDARPFFAAEGGGPVLTPLGQTLVAFLKG